MPVMRLVQTAVEWQADTGHLAEVFLGGLMRPAEPPFSAGPGPSRPSNAPSPSPTPSGAHCSAPCRCPNSTRPAS
ncbi:hypothetical protein SAZ11_14520 [Streptomyces sp. FXJ1.4098]|nr:hypothetical protein [Streptomyces sp. FXJ1.4098]